MPIESDLRFAAALLLSPKSNRPKRDLLKAAAQRSRLFYREAIAVWM
jgi:hypothetical protein